MTDHNHDEPGLQNLRPTNLASFRERLAAKTGREYWRSLNELADSDAFEALVKQEFPRQGGLLEDMSRRDFLKVLGASLALAGLAACTPQDSQKIIPYVKPPEELVPAKPLFYASAMVQDGFAKGVLVQTTYGRPIKVEGNPSHPDSLGATDVFTQASLLEMYDPERAKQVMYQGAPKTWQDFAAAVGPIMANLGDGAGLRILTGPVTSPALNDQIRALVGMYPQAKWTQFSPVGRDNSQAGANQAFGQVVNAVYNFQNADVILSLDCDFLFSEPGHVRYGKDFGSRHQPISTSGTMNRLYVVESSATLTGANADHRLAVKPSQVEAFARAIAGRLGIDAGSPAGEIPGQDWLDPLAADLKRAGRAALVVAGERQPAAVHALAYAMNQALGSTGNTVNFVVPLMANVEDAASGSPAGTSINPFISLQALVQDLNSGAVDTLVILENNPAYTAPADLDFAEAMKKARQSIYLAFYADETASLSTWSIPAAHYMEMWGDALAFDGTPTLVQPVIEPLYGGKSPSELVAALMGQGDARGYDLLRGFWQRQMGGENFERDWRDMLGKGIATGMRALPAENLGQVNAAAFGGTPAAAGGGLEIVFEPDFTIWDGRFSNNAWLQELPKPLTKLTWDNAACISPETADRLGLQSDDVVDIKLRGRSVQAAVYVQPGQPDDVVVVSLGYGRKSGGNVSAGSGFNAYAIRTSEAPWFDSGVELSKTGKTYRLVVTSEHSNMDNRDLIRTATMEEYQAHPEFAQEGEHEPPTLYDTEGVYHSPDYAWGMSINLNTCIGCNACVVACQAENNIPTVGKDQVARGREMHWLRIDRYYQGTAKKAKLIAFQPVPCMHCETAPCEPVCPVEATSHSAEGINEMTYNRCVGTRYCSNNCPYKVRRFNFYKYVEDKEPSLKAMRNPNVTVRPRGVMEKCTYCVQRVNVARTQAEVDGRKIADGEVLTACQQACPTNAIVFGNIHDAGSAVRKLKDSPLNYGLLAELGTKPRTTYLAKVKNQNPMIPEQA
jgi:molybdopterin-containing oxidoreductase family iron-sulfur binding subunit